jgi:hypothetical protein
MGTAFFLAGWVIDLDHALDFTLTWGPHEGFIRMSRMGIGEMNRPNTVYMFLHGYEITLLVALLALFFPGSPWLWGVALGHFFHLILDQVTNAGGWAPVYFLSYRALHRFSHDAVFPQRDRLTRT